MNNPDLVDPVHRQSIGIVYMCSNRRCRGTVHSNFVKPADTCKYPRRDGFGLCGGELTAVRFEFDGLNFDVSYAHE